MHKHIVAVVVHSVHVPEAITAIDLVNFVPLCPVIVIRTCAQYPVHFGIGNNVSRRVGRCAQGNFFLQGLVEALATVVWAIGTGGGPNTAAWMPRSWRV